MEVWQTIFVVAPFLAWALWITRPDPEEPVCIEPRREPVRRPVGPGTAVAKVQADNQAYALQRAAQAVPEAVEQGMRALMRLHEVKMMMPDDADEILVNQLNGLQELAARSVVATVEAYLR